MIPHADKYLHVLTAQVVLRKMSFMNREAGAEVQVVTTGALPSTDVEETNETSRYSNQVSSKYADHSGHAV
jgi:hypothetical protein